MSAQLEQWLPFPAAYAPMNAHAVVQVSGPDAAALLQGQLSNDIAALDSTCGQLSSFNSPKGRVLAFLRVLKHGDNYWLVVDREVHDAFVQRLKMFVLRSKVMIETAPGIRGVAIVGNGIRESLQSKGLPAPSAGECAAHEDVLYLGIPGPQPRIEIYGADDRFPELPFARTDDIALARWDVLFHIPRIMEGNRDAHIAQHLGLDDLGAISFRKGCYTGQEIIARMKYLGKVKKGPAVLVGNGVNVGDTIRTTDERSAGDVVNVAGANGEQLLLAVLNRDAGDAALSVNGNPVNRL